MCACLRVCVGGRVWMGAGRGGIILGNIMKLFSFLYIDASHTAHVHYFSCVYIYIFFSCCVSITFLNMLPLIVFSLNIENVGECCKAQQVCVDQRIAIYKSYILLLTTFRLGKIDP